MLSPNSQYQFQRLTATGLLKTGSGVIGGFLVASGTPTIKIYDNTTNAADGKSTFILLNTMQTVAATPYPLGAKFVNGCYVELSGAGDITFLYE